MYKRRVALLTLAVAAVVSFACGGVTSPSENKQETFSGTLQLNGNAFFQVNAANGGEFSVKITALSPTATATVGVGWYQGANCELVVQQGYGQLNTPALAGAVLQKGPYCVGVFDVGFITVAQNFTVVVSHP
jgi:hypothetical protein